MSYLGRIIYEPSATCGRCEAPRLGQPRTRPLDELTRIGWKPTKRYGLICAQCAAQLARTPDQPAHG